VIANYRTSRRFALGETTTFWWMAEMGIQIFRNAAQSAPQSWGVGDNVRKCRMNGRKDQGTGNACGSNWTSVKA
jgi:hypothetical protein